MLGVIKLIRPKQWIKNVFVLAPLIFAGQFMNSEKVLLSAAIFILFSLTASSVYVINDLHDREDDARHPTKRKRPLASGEISPQQGYYIVAALIALIIGGLAAFPMCIPVITAYFLLNLAYTFYLKKVPVADIIMIASFFVLRIYAGAHTTSIPLSNWMLVTTFCLALFLASIKRRQELINTDSQSRAVLDYYSVALIDQFVSMTATCSVIFYSLFAITIRSELVLTIPFVIFGIMRYLYLVHTTGEGESPTNLLYKDWQIQITLVAWVAICMYLIRGA